MVYGRVKDHVTYSIELFEPFAPSRNHIDQLHKSKNTAMMLQTPFFKLILEFTIICISFEYKRLMNLRK